MYKQSMSERLLQAQMVKNLHKACFLKIAFGHLGIVNASGSTGATTFSHNKGGPYVRRKVIPVNPDTPAQTAVRNEFGSLSQQWRTLSETHRKGWNGAVGEFKKTNSLGAKITLSGLNLFKSLNQNLFDAGQPTITSAPAPVGTTNLNTLDLTVTTGPDSILLGFTATPTAADMYTLVYASPQVSPGINFIKNKLVIIKVLPPATATAANVATEYVNRFGALISGQKLFIGVVTVNGVTGEKSPMLVSSSLIP